MFVGIHQLVVFKLHTHSLAMYNVKIQDSINILQNLPNHQKIMLSSIILLIKHHCKLSNLPTVPNTEFLTFSNYTAIPMLESI